MRPSARIPPALPAPNPLPPLPSIRTARLRDCEHTSSRDNSHACVKELSPGLSNPRLQHLPPVTALHLSHTTMHPPPPHQISRPVSILPGPAHFGGSPPLSCMVPTFEASRAVQNGAETAEEKVRFSNFLPEMRAEVAQRVIHQVATPMPEEERFHIPGREPSEDLPGFYGFPKTDNDIDSLLADTPGLSPSNFALLRSSLVDHLSKLRQEMTICTTRLEKMLLHQAQTRIVLTAEYDRRMHCVVSKFCKTRKEILDRYKWYVRNRRWVENVSTRQRKGCLSNAQANTLKLWLFCNFDNPYPSKKAKKELIQKTDLTMVQIDNWLINARSRVWKPTVEMMSGERLQKALQRTNGRHVDSIADPNDSGDSGCPTPSAATTSQLEDLAEIK